LNRVGPSDFQTAVRPRFELVLTDSQHRYHDDDPVSQQMEIASAPGARTRQPRVSTVMEARTIIQLAASDAQLPTSWRC
jgi:hypothetical protein